MPRHPRSRSPFLLLLLILACRSASADSLPETLIAAKSGTQVPALAALVFHHGAVVEQAVVGVRRNDRPQPAGAEDRFALGSDGKPITATLIARLVDRGVLDWDSPLQKLLPDLAAKVRPEYGAITLRQMLSHRAGLPENVSDMAYFATFFTDTRSLTAQRRAYVQRALSEPALSPPGTAVSYSNTGFLLAAVIAEAVTRQAYEQLMDREVFRPLGMKSARFANPGDAEALGHRHGAPVLEPFATGEDGNPMMFAPAGGGLHMTLRDWARFCADQLAGAEGHGRLLKAATYRQMQTPNAGTSSGLGWGVQASVGGRQGPVLVHAGSDGNWYALVVLFPATGNGALVAANAGEDMGGDQATQKVLGTLLAELAPAAPR